MMRVNGLLHYGLQVPSIEVGESFYSSFGLETAELGNSLLVRCSGRDLDQTVLTEGPEKRLHYVAFSVDADSLPDWQRHLEGLDIRIADAPRHALPGGLWFRDPDGNLVNLRDEALAPWRAFGTIAANVGDEVRRVDQALWLSLADKTQPRRLGHVLIFSSDNARSEEFYRRSLGLRLSDRIPGIATFMNTGPGDHHVFGFIQSTHPGLHHSSWEVASLDQIAVGAQNMAQAGYTTGWGLGRHSIGSNLFHYIRDPWGSWIEYFSDIDKITDNWEPHDWDTAPAVWCPMMPGEFIVNLESKPE